MSDIDNAKDINDSLPANPVEGVTSEDYVVSKNNQSTADELNSLLRENPDLVISQEDLEEGQARVVSIEEVLLNNDGSHLGYKAVEMEYDTSTKGWKEAVKGDLWGFDLPITK